MGDNRSYFDKNGNQIFAGMTMRHNDGELNRVYECGDGDLGFPANNPKFVERHPNWHEEFYSLQQYNLKEWEIVYGT